MLVLLECFLGVGIVGIVGGLLVLSMDCCSVMYSVVWQNGGGLLWRCYSVLVSCCGVVY